MERVTITLHQFVTALAVFLVLTTLILSSMAISGHIDFRDDSIEVAALKPPDGFEGHEVHWVTGATSGLPAVVEDGTNGLAGTASTTTATGADHGVLKGQAVATAAANSNLAVGEKGLSFHSQGKDNEFVVINPPTGTIANSYELYLPAIPGTIGQILQTDANGNLSFVTNGNNNPRLDELSAATTIPVVWDTANQTFQITGGNNYTIGPTGAAATLTLQAIGGGVNQLILNSAGSGTGAIDINTTVGSIDIDSADNITINAQDNITIQTDSTDGAIFLNSDREGDIALHIDANEANTSEVIIDAGTLDINSNTAFTIDGTTTSSLTVTGAGETLTLAALGAGANQVILNSAGTGANAIHINATAGGVDIDAAGIVAIDSTGGAINIGHNATAGAINVGTNNTARTITVGNAIGATAFALNTGPTGGIDITVTNTNQSAIEITANTVDSGKIIDISSTGLTGGTVLDMEVNALTTGIACNIQSSSAAFTGSLCKLVNSGNNVLVTGIGLDVQLTGAANVGQALNIVQNSNAGTDARALKISSAQVAGSVVCEILANAATTSDVLKISANLLSTGSALDITSTSTGMTGSMFSLVNSGNNAAVTGIGLDVQLTGAANTGQALNIVQSSSAGAASRALKITSSQIEDAAVCEIVANAATTSDVFLISADALTGGSVMDVTSTSTGMTGSMSKYVISGSNAANTGNIIDIQTTGANSTITPLKITNSESVSATDSAILMSMLAGANNAGLRVEYRETDITIADAFTTTVSNFFPANSIPILLVLRTTTVIPGAAHITDIGITGTADGFDSGNHSGVDESITFHLPKGSAITNGTNGLQANTGFGHSSTYNLLLTHGDPGATTGRVRAGCWMYIVTVPDTV